MKWPWRRRSTDVGGGQAAREKAERELARTRSETPYYERIAREQRLIRERNRWGETIAAIARREYPT